MMHHTPRSTRLRPLLCSALLGVAAMFTSLPQLALAQTTMKLASATINDVQHEWQKEFAKGLQARVGDQINTEIYPASQLGTIPRMTEGVLFGTIELFTTPTSFLVGTDARFQVFEAPGLFDSPQHLKTVLHEPEYRQHIEELALNKGLRIVGVIYNSPLILTSTQPVKSLDGLAGLKIRTFASPLQTEPMKAFGASPLPLALSEVVPALQSGNIDGMLAGMPILTAFKFYDVSKYVLDLKFAYVVSVSVVNELWFQSQPEAVRAAILAAGREAEESVFPWGVANVERTEQLWTENGGEIFPLTADERSHMMTVFQDISDKLLSQDEAVAAEYTRMKDLAAAQRP